MIDQWDDQFRRVHDLITRKLDEAATPEEEAELRTLLRDDAELRALYVEHIQDTADLRWSYAHTTIPIEDDAPAVASLLRAESDLIDAEPPIGKRARTRRWQTLWAVATAMLLGVGVYLFTSNPKQPPSAGSVATVTRTIDAIWKDGAEHDELSRLHVGQDVSLESGQIELIFDTGVEVVVIGPAKFNVSSADSIYSSRGTISARVGANGIGFTVDTPTARVIDLGTEFGVAIDDDGETEVAVFSGIVDLALGSSPAVDANRRRLNQGEAIRVGTNGNVDRVMAIASDRFPVSAAVRSAGGPETPIIGNVTDNIRAGDSNKFYQIVRTGLHDDSHAFVDRNHQWNGVTSEGFPLDLEGAEYVMPFNDDKFHEDLEVSIDVTQPANLYIFYSDSMTPPKWLQENFIDTGVEVGLDEAKSVYHKDFKLAAGPGKSVDMTFSVWKREVRKPQVIHLGAVSKHRATLGYNMYGIALTPLEPAVKASDIQ